MNQNRTKYDESFNTLSGHIKEGTYPVEEGGILYESQKPPKNGLFQKAKRFLLPSFSSVLDRGVAEGRVIRPVHGIEDVLMINLATSAYAESALWDLVNLSTLPLRFAPFIGKQIIKAQISVFANALKIAESTQGFIYNEYQAVKETVKPVLDKAGEEARRIFGTTVEATKAGAKAFGGVFKGESTSQPTTS